MILIATLLFLLMVAPLAAKEPPVDYKELPPLNDNPLEDRHVIPGPYQNLPAIDESRWVPLPPVKQPYYSFGKLDPVLSEACQLGDFATLPLNRIILQFVGDKGRALMQVVPPLYRHLLVDRRKLARPGYTYYFLDTAQPDCEVRVDANRAIMSFPTGRTTLLPPADPRAVQKRTALIASWPKVNFPKTPPAP